MEDDTHLCLRCNTAIIGLDNYVNHRKNPSMCQPNRVPALSADSSQERGESELLISHQELPATNSASTSFTTTTEANSALLETSGNKKTPAGNEAETLLSSCGSPIYSLSTASYELSTSEVATSQTLAGSSTKTSDSLLSTFSLSPGVQVLSSNEKTQVNDTLLATCQSSSSYALPSFGLTSAAQSLSSHVEKATSADALLVACSSYPSPSFGLGNETHHLPSDGKAPTDALLTTCSSYPSPSSFGLSPGSQPLQSDGKSSNDALLATCSPNYPSPSSYDIYSRAYDFFSSLELQCKVKTVEVTGNREDHPQKEVMSPDSLCISPGILVESEGCDLGSDSESSDNFYPPQSFTGGKWKPGCRPDTLGSEANHFLAASRSTLETSKDQFSVIDNAIREDVFALQNSFQASDKTAGYSRKSKKIWPVRHSRKMSPYGRKKIYEKPERLPMVVVPSNIVTRNKVRSHVSEKLNQCTAELLRMELSCPDCLEEFPDRLAIVYHLHQVHWSKLDQDKCLKEIVLNQDLLLRVLPFQCLICSYYCNRAEDLLLHIRNKHHCQKTAQLKNPLMCQACDYECRGCDDMIGHISSKVHKQTMENLIKASHPIIIATSKMPCSYCVGKCAYQTSVVSRQSVKGKHLEKSASFSQELDPNDDTKCTTASTSPIKDLSMNDSGNEQISNHVMTTTDNTSNLSMDKHSENGDTSKCNEDLANSAECDGDDSATNMKSVVLCHMCSLVLGDTCELESHLRKDHDNCDLLESVVKETVLSSYKDAESESNSLETHLKITTTDSNKEVSTQSELKKNESEQVESQSCMDDLNEEVLSLVNNDEFHIMHTDENESEEKEVQSNMGKPVFECKTCLKTFSQKSTLTRHMELHSGLKKFRCDECDFTTLHKFSLKLHKQTHSSDRPKPFLCEICGYSTTTMIKLKLHDKKHNKVTLPYKCDLDGCTSSFRWKSELNYHKNKHLNTRPYQCNMCNYSGKTAHQLTQHKRSHTGEKPFKCKHCDYSSALSSLLIRHMRNHSDVKLYKCPYCEYASNNQENIRKHVLKTKKHKGKKIYPCKLCHFSSNEFKEYQKHAASQHQDYSPQGLRCSQFDALTEEQIKKEQAALSHASCDDPDEQVSADNQCSSISEQNSANSVDPEVQVVYMDDELDCVEVSVSSDGLTNDERSNEAQSSNLKDSIVTKRFLIFVQ